GRSNAIHPDRLPPTPTVNARLDLPRYTDPEHVAYDTNYYAPLSFDRPEPMNHIGEHTKVTDPIEGFSACHLAPAEWRLLGWLERECVPYDLYAETQLHSGALDLDRYKVLILSTHPEYWSREMFRRVKAWVGKRGGRLIYLGGGGINCEVEFDDPSTMICKNGDRREIDRRGLESRFHLGKESEATLLGVGFTDAGIMTAAPYRVIEGEHWVFEGTGLRTGDTFGERSLHMRCPGGASGHETDKILPSSPPNVLLLAEGLNPEQGGAHMVYYETPGGGAVFSTGSIAYPSSLLVDEGASMITANVIRRLMTS
ncbi:MAG TPA: N,N-dimethylformamidase beta subunit family domain-containing protein, partial [Isosphaeraceae bacterium]|nr:N,N-dimethylformamidase beta subunit family domain-containing protein [Isosphaeraceae bacterium]